MPAPRIIDIAPLERLLLLSGATGAQQLIAALIGDLQTTQTGLDLAWNGPDFAALRAQAHVLIALAGTIGDTELQTLAQNVTTAAHAQAIETLLELKPKTMAGLVELIALLSQPHFQAGV